MYIMKRSLNFNDVDSGFFQAKRISCILWIWSSLIDYDRNDKLSLSDIKICGVSLVKYLKSKQ